MKHLLILVLLLQVNLSANPTTFWGKRALKAERSGDNVSSLRFLRRAAKEGDSYAIDKLALLFPKKKSEVEIEKDSRDLSLFKTFEKLFAKQSDLAQSKTMEYFQSKLDSEINGLELTRFVNAVLYNSSFSYTSKDDFEEYFKGNQIDLSNTSLNHYTLSFTREKSPKTLDRMTISIQDVIVFKNGVLILDEDFDPCILIDNAYGEFQTLSYINRANKSWTTDKVFRIQKSTLAKVKNRRKLRLQKKLRQN
ncbi:hypothetical protein MJH12_11075 [bacterium]|nr:hypothetical protein [bacterium]